MIPAFVALLGFAHAFPASANLNRWAHLGPQGALSSALVMDPSTAGTLYVGVYGGGVFKTTDGGGSWTAVNTGLSNRDVITLAIDPVDTATIYAGAGNQLWKSEDGGASWQKIWQSTGGYIYVRAVVVDPLEPSNLFLAGRTDALFKSTDGGVSWELAVDGFPESPTRDVYALAVDPVNPNVVYAGVTGLGVYKTVNGGAGWTNASTGLPANPSCRALAIDPTEPSTVYMASTWKVYKTVNSAAQWLESGPGLPDYVLETLAVDPNAPDVIFVGTSGGGCVQDGRWRHELGGGRAAASGAVDPGARRPGQRCRGGVGGELGRGRLQVV